MNRPAPATALIGALVAAGSAAAFATLPILGRWAIDDGMRSATILQWRFGLAALVLTLIGAYRIPLARRTRIALLGTGLIYTVQTSLYFAALERISAGTTALLLYLAPAFVVIYSFFLGRRPHRMQLVAVVLATTGLMVIVGLPGDADASTIGLLLAAAAGATFAWYVLLGEIAFSTVPPLAIAVHSMTGALIGFTVVDLVSTGDLDRPISAYQWLLVIIIVIVPTLIAIPMLFWAIGRIGAGPTSIIATAEPVFTLIFAAVALGEAITVVQVIGGAFILAAAGLAQRSASSNPTTNRTTDRSSMLS